MAANPSKRDAWGPYDDIVFVLVPSGLGRLKPNRGVILERPDPRDRKGRALVFYRDDTGRRPEWRLGRFCRQELILVPVDPNWTGTPRGLRNHRGARQAVPED